MWAFLVADDTSVTAAHCLFYYIICDLAGYPMILGSDRGRAFTESVIKELAEVLGIMQVIGTSYHPQSQAVVERPHREFNLLCKTFMDKFEDWDLLVYIFVWYIRTTTKIVNSYFTPYEIITGMKPRQPTDAIYAQPAAVSKLDRASYVKQLVDYLKRVHAHVDAQHARVREQESRSKLRADGAQSPLQVGDHCFVKKGSGEHTRGVSTRFDQTNYDQVYQIAECLGDGEVVVSYVVSDLYGQREGLGFQNPVGAERITPVNLMPLVHESADRHTRISVDFAGGTKEGTVLAQAANGAVQVHFDTEPVEDAAFYHLEQLKYRWL